MQLNISNGPDNISSNEESFCATKTRSNNCNNLLTFSRYGKLFVFKKRSRYRDKQDQGMED